MFPTSFAESNTIAGPPDGIDPDQCQTISVLATLNPQGVPIVISCWKLTAEELAEINKTGRVWLTCMSGMIPCYLTVEKPFSSQAEEKEA